MTGSGPHPRFFFVRHGETEWNRAGRLQGQHDVPLNARGRDQASAAGRALGRVLAGRGLAARDLDFVASPLLRTRETMRLVRVALGLPLEGFGVEDRLKEIRFGSWEGRTWDELKATQPGALAERRADKWSFVPPNGESYALLEQRIEPWLDTLRDDTIVVGHGGVARVLLHRLAGLDPRRAPDAEIWQGRVLVFEARAATWV